MIVLIFYVYLLKNKNEAINMFQIFLNEVENQFNRKIKRLHSDRGMEYDADEFIKLYNSYGIILEKTILYSLKMDGKVERKNITYSELVVAILLKSRAVSHW